MTTRKRKPRAKKPLVHKVLPGALEAVREYETKAILAALQETRGDREQAATKLKISLRTLEGRLTEYGIREEANRISVEAGFPDKAARARATAYGGDRYRSEVANREG